MKFSLKECKEYFGDWLVEVIDDEDEGQVRVTRFSGPNAENRARNYLWDVQHSVSVIHLISDVGMALIESGRWHEITKVSANKEMALFNFERELRGLADCIITRMKEVAGK